MDNQETLDMEVDDGALRRLASTDALIEVEDTQTPSPEVAAGETKVAGEKGEDAKADGAKGDDSRKSPTEPNIHVNAFLEEPPVVARRQQLSASFRKKGGDDNEEQLEAAAEEEQEGKEEEVPEVPAPKAKAKAKARAKKAPAPKMSAKAKAKAIVEEQAKAKASSARRVGGGNENDNDIAPPPEPSGSKRRRTDEVAKPKAKTWARRYPPTEELELLRFNAIRHTYEQEIAPFLKSQSLFQDSCVPLNHGLLDWTFEARCFPLPTLWFVGPILQDLHPFPWQHQDLRRRLQEVQAVGGQLLRERGCLRLDI